MRMIKICEEQVKNPGILEVPKDKSVDQLPVSHFKKLIDKNGRKEIITALTNLERWNKNQNPELSKWATKMKSQLKDYE